MGGIIVRDPNVNSHRPELTLQKYTTNYTILKDSPSEAGFVELAIADVFQMFCTFLNVVGTGVFSPTAVKIKVDVPLVVGRRDSQRDGGPVSLLPPGQTVREH